MRIFKGDQPHFILQLSWFFHGLVSVPKEVSGKGFDQNWAISGRSAGFLAISGPRLSGIRGHTILVSALATMFQKIKRMICVRHVIASQAVEVPQVANMKRILAF